MRPYKGECKECKEVKWISNDRGLCMECVYRRNHQGKSMFDVRKSFFKSSPPKFSVKKWKKQDFKDKQNKDRDMYRWLFDNKPQICEECGHALPDEFEDRNGKIVYVARYSHILSKGAYPEFRYDKRNFNILCYHHHSMWEHGDKESMKIYPGNALIIQQLKDEKNNKS
jgi:hypothetical protein